MTYLPKESAPTRMNLHVEQPRRGLTGSYSNSGIEEVAEECNSNQVSLSVEKYHLHTFYRPSMSSVNSLSNNESMRISVTPSSNFRKESPEEGKDLTLTPRREVIENTKPNCKEKKSSLISIKALEVNEKASSNGRWKKSNPARGTLLSLDPHAFERETEKKATGNWSNMASDKRGREKVSIAEKDQSEIDFTQSQFKDSRHEENGDLLNDDLGKIEKRFSTITLQMADLNVNEENLNLSEKMKGYIFEIKNMGFLSKNKSKLARVQSELNK